MSALRRALLGSVFMMATMASAVSAYAAEGEASGTSWADSVQRALAAREQADPTFANPQAKPGHRASQKGMASWYGGRFNHRRTSSGSAFDKLHLTAAHPTAPLGSKLLVTSEETGRSVVVTVNDRGPYSHNRIIDLSQAAAARIGMLNTGVAHVKVEQAPIEVAMASQDDGAESLDSSSVMQFEAAKGRHVRPLQRPRVKRAAHHR
ncbi:hypothetical protein HK27_00350 [Acetobacter orientalis]|uniref:Endolytic peptidoglycan transglycosylase RlpA n=2 Tax=Acetobacter orientalis TaxID=146474 RepID=A0A251ZYW4_9PROT|nr:septal ring lytic transglycosylase RlpA family protein [Acetobacter orientalis]OUI79869.1 hypothetical protein HK12_11355 [Acetobacter orientalis]OUJ18023.1 hypothetical protein HK27_00350 [Acetobacter orientalis]BBC80164.1 rare lipoprotein A [Acetobacter orientalis]GAN65342.1 lipoprotein A [Acetobacter orientalis]GEL62205.1 hypothetical protein AOR02nite_20470 [Acetobacter orientalis]